MNFFPATLTDVGVKLPFGEVTLTQEVHDVIAQHDRPNNGSSPAPTCCGWGSGALA